MSIPLFKSDFRSCIVCMEKNKDYMPWMAIPFLIIIGWLDLFLSFFVC